MYRILRITLTALVVIAVAATCGICAPTKSPKKSAPKRSVAKSVAATPSGPKLLTIVAGQPFETPPSGGPSKLSISLCAEETEPATFTVRYGRALAGVRVAAGDLTGPGKIGKENISVRLVQDVDLVSAESVDIDSTPKQLWVDVTVPKYTKPGVYKGAIGFYSQGKLIDVEPIDVAVRPLRLVGSSKQYALHTSIGPGAQGVCEMSGEAYSQFLSQIAKMGFRAVSVSADPSRAPEALNACAAAGLVGATPVVTFASGSSVPAIEDVRAVEAARKSAGIPSVFCFCACNPASDDEVQASLDRCVLFHRAGMQVAATVADEAVAGKLLPFVDAVNYRVDMPYVQALINGGTTRTNKWEWYWWDARESVDQNRINAGIALWRSGLYGCIPYWMPKDVADQPGNLDSVLCEALREGVDDTRYLTTYMKAVRELKDKKRQSDKEYIASTETYLSAFMAKPLDKVTPADLRAFRAKMAEFSIKLGAML